jgi:hypothetical protein
MAVMIPIATMRRLVERAIEEGHCDHDEGRRPDQGALVRSSGWSPDADAGRHAILGRRAMASSSERTPSLATMV